ncbi:MAG: YdeI/OmpD-associated family protein, partial [Acidobacteria bacterium]|nr:YdeI/OmpD-associated family protein [Acidobacteriota bacterium]
DFQAALEQNPKAKAFFATLKSGNRYAILFRLQTAKKTETREKRIRQFIEMLERGETIHPQS